MRRHRGHQDRPEAQDAGPVDRFLRPSVPRCCSTCRAKSTSMMPFFLTMPISRMMPTIAITLRSRCDRHQQQQRAEAGRRQRRDDGDRVDQALVEHAEDEVDHEQRGGDQDRRARQRIARRPARCPGSSSAATAACRVAVRSAGWPLIASPIAVPGSRLNEIVTDGNWPWWLTTSGATLTTLSTSVDSGTCWPVEDLT